jgi:hypothetical protein
MLESTWRTPRHSWVDNAWHDLDSCSGYLVLHATGSNAIVLRFNTYAGRMSSASLCASLLYHVVVKHAPVMAVPRRPHLVLANGQMLCQTARVRMARRSIRDLWVDDIQDFSGR